MPCTASTIAIERALSPTHLTVMLVRRFFHDMNEFEEEVALYRDAALRKILPKIWYAHDNADARVRSRSGFVFPPFFVLERGMTLKVRLRSAPMYLFLAGSRRWLL